MKQIPMQFPYGAVYFRKSNPPKEDWERDYAQAARDGNNIFRHWFMWGNIEVAPGKFDWDDYDRQMELAEKNGIKTIIAEIDNCVPQWLYYERPDLLCQNAQGQRPGSSIGASSATGGFVSGGLCLDKPEARALVENFLVQLARRYRGSAARLGYDIWNECSTPRDLCYCEDTRKAFQQWLKNKYGSLETINRKWLRYSYTAWEQVSPPSYMILSPEWFDWFDFKKENAYKHMEWRVDILRREDEGALMCAHGMAYSLEAMPLNACDDWLAAEKVDVYGLTFIQSRKGSEAWKQFNAVDMTRCGARGKPIWHAESQAGPLWLQPQVVGRPREDGRIATPENLRIWNLTSMACGARGILCPRWRPLLDGSLFGAFGGYGMDGSATPNSDMAASIAKWANDPTQSELMQAECVKGDVGILLIPESQSASLLLSQFGTPDSYKPMATGAYRGFFDNNIQADWVRMEDIGQYNALYLPCPIMLAQAHADKLIQWVKDGGRLVSEGCPGYFGDHGHVGTVQPNLGLDKLFGVLQTYVEFTPDILDDFAFDLEGRCVAGGEYLQFYRPSTAKALGTTEQGDVIAVRNSFFDGETMLIGTSVSKGYATRQEKETREFFASLTEFFGLSQHVRTDNPMVSARLHKSKDGLFLWLINQSQDEQTVECVLSDRCAARGIQHVYWGKDVSYKSGNTFIAAVGAQDAVIIGIQTEQTDAFD